MREDKECSELRQRFCLIACKADSTISDSLCSPAAAAAVARCCTPLLPLLPLLLLLLLLLFPLLSLLLPAALAAAPAALAPAAKSASASRRIVTGEGVAIGYGPKGRVGAFVIHVSLAAFAITALEFGAFKHGPLRPDEPR